MRIRCDCLAHVLFFLTPILVAAEPDWHASLWLGRGDVWRARFPVTLANPSDAALVGAPVALTVGDAPGQAPLAGIRVEALRVTDAAGTQLLYGLWSPDQSECLTTGAIPAGATLVLPAVCAPRTSTVYTVYFDNPSAWGLADFFDKRAFTEINGGFEKGVGGNPLGWMPAQTDARHRLAWSEEKPFAGARCLKAEADDGAPATWFGFVRSDFAIVPGARCTIRVRIRGERVKGNAGWYVHVGDEKNSQRVNKTERAGEGSFDWRELTLAFTVPDGATRLQTGSVLYGTGTAWYDDFRFETDRQPPQAFARAGAVERLALNETGADAHWPEKPGRLSRLLSGRSAAPDWCWRLPVRVANLRDEPAGAILASADLNSAARGLASPRFLLTLDGRPVETCRLGDRLLFTCSPDARTLLTYYLYVAPSPDVGQSPGRPAKSALGSDIPSDQVLADRPGETDAAAFAKLLNNPVNLVKNPDFENGTAEPDIWAHTAAEPGVVYALGSPGGFGRHHACLTVPEAARDLWRGWHQSVPVTPGRTYLYGGWLACEGLKGAANLHAHLRDAKGAVVSGGFLSAGPAVSADCAWTPLFATARVPPNATHLQLHLTMNDHGTLKHDGIFVAECLEAQTGDPQTPPLCVDELAVWPVASTVKVFRETPPGERAPLAVSLARNEEEAVQLALRAGRDLADVRVEVDAPIGARGRSLDSFSVGWVGYVPIDHRTAYYNLKTPTWELKFPTSAGASDGWSGWWPDPIKPAPGGSLTANQTQAVWLSFRTTADTPPGVYRGRVRLVSGGRIIKTVPLAVTVWGFTLPAEPSCAAIYDLRLNRHWLADGQPADATRERLMRFMAGKKVCPDEIPCGLRFTRGADGRVSCDFSEYDRAAKLYFDELKFPVSYTPHDFYLFGWEHPPKAFLGEKPYDGEYPYVDADRTKLRPAYKDAYQACLRLYWEHVKAQGWADKLVLYISDEPFLTKKHIIDQMKACCDMIHEVDPAIRIYSSTWRHCPDWNGYLDIWGVGHYGCFPVAEMQARRAAGDRIWFTTDGQMCTDTPFCAVERLLPHYCFKYGTDAYEFWGISWLTYDPWRFGWHSYIQQSSTPGESYYVRYPNGDGYLLYPGLPIGVSGPVTTVRLEAARDGVEDYEYLLLLKAAAVRTSDPEAAQLLADFAALIDIPNAGGRYSSKILPDPARLAALRLRAGETLERLNRRPRGD